jgi:hypothetical protein
MKARDLLKQINESDFTFESKVKLDTYRIRDHLTEKYCSGGEKVEDIITNSVNVKWGIDLYMRSWGIKDFVVYLVTPLKIDLILEISKDGSEETIEKEIELKVEDSEAVDDHLPEYGETLYPSELELSIDSKKRVIGLLRFY